MFFLDRKRFLQDHEATHRHELSFDGDWQSAFIRRIDVGGAFPNCAVGHAGATLDRAGTSLTSCC